MGIWTVFSVSTLSKVSSLGSRSPVWESIHFKQLSYLNGYKNNEKLSTMYSVTVCLGSCSLSMQFLQSSTQCTVQLLTLLSMKTHILVSKNTTFPWHCKNVNTKIFRNAIQKIWAFEVYLKLVFWGVNYFWIWVKYTSHLIYIYISNFI